MSEKFLGEADWKKFSKSGDYKDAALLKALAALDKAERGAPAEQLKVLDEVEKQAEALLKAHKGDKALAGYVDDLGKAAKKQRKQLENEARESEEEGEEDASPALLTTKMLPLLRELKKGEARMPVLIALAGKDTAVLIMRRAITPARRKLLNEYLQVSGGIKYVAGESLLEEKALTFVVQSPAAGLAKRLKAALLAQTGLRVSVRVRGEEGSVEDDGEEEEAHESDSTEPPTSSASDRPDETAHASDSGDAKAAQYRQKLEALTPALQRALTGRSGDVSKMRAVAEFAREKAEAGNPAAALQALDALEKLLAAAAPRAPAGVAADTADPEGLEHWQKVRAGVIAQLKDIAKHIATARHADSSAALIELNAVIKQLTERPTTTQQVAALERYLGQDEVVAEVCEFAFDLRTPLLNAIDRLKAGLEATA